MAASAGTSVGISVGTTGGSSGSGVIVIPNGGASDSAGAPGYEHTTQTTGACVRERIATRKAEAGAGGEGGEGGVSTKPNGDGGAPAADSADGEGGGGFELGHGDLTLLVVFDKSGSMEDPWDERTKWQVANESLMKAIDPVIDNLTLGTIFFPQPAGGCDVEPLTSELQIGYKTGRAFRSYWEQTEETRVPDGSTPLERALRQADLAVEQGCELGLLDDRFRVVLVTDGMPTCGDNPTAIVELVADWNLAGVETWVMGLPGSDSAKALLDAIALAGSTGESQMVGTPGALDNGLAAAAR